MISRRKSILETSTSASDTQSIQKIFLSTDSDVIENRGKELKDSQKITRSSRGKIITSNVSSITTAATTNNSQSSPLTVTLNNYEDSSTADGTSKSPITLKATMAANICTSVGKEVKELKCLAPSIEAKTRGSSRAKMPSIESSSSLTGVKTDESNTIKNPSDNSTETKNKIQLDNNIEKLNEKSEVAEEVTKAVSSPLRRTARKRLNIPEKAQQKPTIVTRKSAAMDLAATTRSTRARRNSLEPMKGTTRRTTRKQLTINEQATKRKRTDSIRDDADDCEIKKIKLELPEDEPGKAVTKEYVEIKEDDYSSQETRSDGTFHEFDIELKLEPIDPSEEDCENGSIETISFLDSESSSKMEEKNASLTIEGCLSKEIKVCGKSGIKFDQESKKQRPSRRKIVNTASPSIYATRRRNEIALRKTKSITSNATIKKCDFSKIEDKPLCFGKEIKNTEDVSLTNELCFTDKQNAVDINENASENLKNCEPLTVDISLSIEVLKEPEPSTSTELITEKAASLSPELISEGVSEISVKQFYKKPEFLENNLGIEEDPKLGEIMQNAEKYNENKILSIDKCEVENDHENIPLLANQTDSVNSILVKETDVDKTISSVDEINVNVISVDNLENIEQSTEEDKENCDNFLDHEIKIKDLEKLTEPDVDEKLEIDSFCTEVSTDDCKKFEIKIDAEKINETKERVKDNLNKSNEKKLDEENLLEDVHMSSNEQNSDNMESNKINLPLVENDETLREKEKHLKTLGLLSLKAAAVQVEQDKTKRRKLERTIQNDLYNVHKKMSMGTNGANGIKLSNEEYTGTLKTVIKLNRKNDIFQPGTSSDHKRSSFNGGVSSSQSGNTGGRQSLKITFQKGRARGVHLDKDNQATVSPEDTYYTIQNENEGLQTVIHHSPTVTHGRKSLNRNNTIDSANNSESTDMIASSSNNKKEDKQAILIPEKASSFSIHPERLCQDQCYYCGGKFGLYDTPCHVAQIKSAEKQQKILENEEKLLVDNCLCDACFRHVDRRANAPSYKKRLSAPGSLETVVNKITQNSLESNDIEGSSLNKISNAFGSSIAPTICFIPDCQNTVAHSLRRKCIRKTVKKLFFNFDMSSLGTFVQVCAKHYEAVMQYLGCALCKRRLGKNQIFYVTADTAQVEKLLADQGLPVQLQYNNSFCKLCRYYINLLLQQPQNSKEAKQEFIRNYRRRLLQFFNIQVDETSEIDGNDEDDESLLTEENAAISKRTKNIHENSLNKTNVLKTHGTTCSPESSNSSSIEKVSENCQQQNATSNRMMLENDVMVDYDVPIISDSSSSSPPPYNIARSKLQSILQQSNSNKDDISLVLRSNPNISMRELFPGEEDLGLQINVPFGSSSSQKTPEGWTRVQTFLQYDEPTRQLWEDLQKPYGNQSSFLRHLILLEKYYRNGDLILSQNANSNSTVYSNTVQNRLQSFDNTTCEELPSPKNSIKPNQTLEPSRSNSVEKLHKQLLNNSVTITTRPKESSIKSTVVASTSIIRPANDSSRSILKTNLLNNKSAIEIVPINTTCGNNFNNHDNNASTKQQKLIEAANKLIGNSTSIQSPLKCVSTLNTCGDQSTMPPELISLNRRQRTSTSSQQRQRPQTVAKASSSRGGTGPLDVIVLPDTLSAQERMQSKHWRPTLMPVSSAAHLNHQGPLFQTADGRRLPAMVQVQSGKRPFLISVHDYNRMCILRREKLLRDQMLKAGKSKSTANVIDSNLSCNNQLQQKIGNTQVSHKTNVNQASQKKSSSSSLNSRRQSASFVAIAPKPPPYNLSASLSKPNISTNQVSNQVVGQQTFFQKNNCQVPLFQNTVSSTVASSGGLAISSVASLSPWMWNKSSDSNQILNGIASQKSLPSSTMTSANLSKALTSSNVSTILKRNVSISLQEPTTVGARVSSSIPFDTNLLSKIPKSLTVIPQHKMMAITTTHFKNSESNNSIEDLTNT